MSIRRLKEMVARTEVRIPIVLGLRQVVRLVHSRRHPSCVEKKDHKYEQDFAQPVPGNASLNGFGWDHGLRAVG